MYIVILVTLLMSKVELFANGNENARSASIPRIEPSKNSTIKIGENIDLDCKINATDFNCSWSRNVNFNPEIPAKLSRRKKILSCVYSIKDATLHDDGIYYCIFSRENNPDFNISFSAIHLTVLQTPDEPSIVFEDEEKPAPRILDIMDDYDRNLECISKNGNPPAELKWFLNETQIDGNYSAKATKISEKLMMTAVNRFRLQQNISKNIGKVYILKCIAFHKPQNLTQITDIKLKFPTSTSKANAHIDVMKAQYNSSMAFHINQIPIHCSADGNPAPTFHWEKISTEGKWTIVGNGSTIISTSGTYRCAAINKHSDKFVFSPNITVAVTHIDEHNHNSMASTTTIAVTVFLMIILIIATIIGGYIYKKKGSCIKKAKQREYELVPQFTTNKTILAIEKQLK